MGETGCGFRILGLGGREHCKAKQYKSSCANSSKSDGFHAMFGIRSVKCDAVVTTNKLHARIESLF